MKLIAQQKKPLECEETIALDPIPGVSKRTKNGYQVRNLQELASTAFNMRLLTTLKKDPSEIDTQIISAWKQEIIKRQLPQNLLNILCVNAIRDAKISHENRQQLQSLLNCEPITNALLQLGLLNAFAQYHPQVLNSSTLQLYQEIINVGRAANITLDQLNLLVDEKKLHDSVKQKRLFLYKYLNTETKKIHYLICKAQVSDEAIEETFKKAHQMNDSVAITSDALQDFIQ